MKGMSPVLITLALATFMVGTAATAGPSTGSAPPKTTEPAKDAETCPVMMQGSGTTEEGRKAMQEFMQPPKGAQAMTSMMEMARRMGNGDPMLGMTRMMEMMGGHGGNGRNDGRPGRSTDARAEVGRE